MSLSNLMTIRTRVQGTTEESPLALLCVPGEGVDCVFASTVLVQQLKRKGDENYVATIHGGMSVTEITAAMRKAVCRV